MTNIEILESIGNFSDYDETLFEKYAIRNLAKKSDPLEGKRYM